MSVASIEIRASWNEQLYNLGNEVCGCLRVAESRLKYLEETVTTKEELEAISAVIIGLKIALDGLTKRYD